MKAKISRIAGAGLMSLSMVLGLAGFASAQVSVVETGPDSVNVVKQISKNKVRVKNNNDLRLKNDNYQDSVTGDAKAIHNTTAGDARTGAASNANSLNVRAVVDNSATAVAAAKPPVVASSSTDVKIDNTGPDSKNIVKVIHKNDVKVTNDNFVKVTNNNSQYAESGDAKVIDNTTGGSAVSGNASNTNSTTMTFEIKN